jgi:hypothetical protein
MKTALKTTAFAALLLTPLAVSPAAAQPAPYNEVGATMGHWHIISKDVEANKKLFIAMGGKLYMPGGQPLMMFPHVYINLTLGDEKATAARKARWSITSASSSTTCRSA